MTNPEMPIRTAADKLSKDEKGEMYMTKCLRRYVSCHPGVHAESGDGDDDDETVRPVGTALQAEIEAIVRQAHEALGCGAYSLFALRVDDRDPLRPVPYIIECCAFWSFTPKSAISLILKASGVDFE